MHDFRLPKKRVTRQRISRRKFARRGAGMLAASAFSLRTSGEARTEVLDAHMHLESYVTYWEGLEDEIIVHYDYAGVDRGVVFTAWTPTVESNDRTLAAWRRYPDRFIPFGHIRTEDRGWQKELERIGKLGWKGIKLHQNEISRDPDLEEMTLNVVRQASACGVRIVLLHLQDVQMIDRLSVEIEEVDWIIPHMGSYDGLEEMRSYCDLVKRRPNVFLDTSGAQYHRFGEQIERAGVEKILFASDGFWFNPAVEKAKIEVLQLPTPFRTPRLTDREISLILGGNLARLLQF